MPLSITIDKPLTDVIVDISGGGAGYVAVQATVTGGTPYQVKAKIYSPTQTPDPAPPGTSTLLTGSGPYAGSVPGGTCGTYYHTLPQFQVMAWAGERNLMTGVITWYPATPTLPYGHCGGGSTGVPTGGGAAGGRATDDDSTIA